VPQSKIRSKIGLMGILLGKKSKQKYIFYIKMNSIRLFIALGGPVQIAIPGWFGVGCFDVNFPSRPQKSGQFNG